MARILLVEDNEMNRDMLSRRLKRKGFEVVSAPDGITALEIVSGASPDLILMDMSLPEMDGWECTKKIKSRDELSCIPIIGLSAHAMAGDREKALMAGCDDYDTKPIDFKRLVNKIKFFLEGETE